MRKVTEKLRKKVLSTMSRIGKDTDKCRLIAKSEGLNLAQVFAIKAHKTMGTYKGGLK